MLDQMRVRPLDVPLSVIPRLLCNRWLLAITQLRYQEAGRVLKAMAVSLNLGDPGQDHPGRPRRFEEDDLRVVATCRELPGKATWRCSQAWVSRS
jgi:hypothetical protein